jgi:4-amino-4-deoxy-L-arabinose transferase-like glycosyltransferase
VPRIGFVLLLFGVGLWPFSASFVAHHPDERHYTDAALWMLRNGDFLIPHCADGSLRFEKPILTYWVIAASYAVFGISPLSSRLPFLLAGCGVLWLT